MKAHTKSWFALIGLVVTALGLIALWPRPTRAAGPWYVAPGGSDSNACLSAVSPCGTINGALGKGGFTPGETILVATGTYTGTETEVVTLSISATLSGGWNSGFTAQTSMSTLDGQGARRGMTVNGGVTAIVERFVVQNGFDIFPGGGIVDAGGFGNPITLTLTNSIISGNVSKVTGGGIYNTGTMTISNTTISGNSAGDSCCSGSGGGGGIENHGTVILNNSTIQDNTILGGFSGGGIDNSGEFTLNNSTVNGNTSPSEGAGICNTGTLTLNHSTVSGNAATGNLSTQSGGICNTGTLTLNHSTVSGNKTLGNTPTQIGGIYNGGTLTLNHSTVSGNTGSGIHNNAGIAILNNSSISGNTAMQSGGLYNTGTLTLNNSTISGNTAMQSGGIYNNDTYGTVALRNSIVAGNMASSIGPDCIGTMSSSGYNIIGNTSGCTFTPGTGDLTNVDAKLGLLQDNGGATPTHALLLGSPAIDAGNPAGCVGSAGLLTIDQRDLARFGRCDIGAYELQPIGFSAKIVNTSTSTPGRPLTYTIALTNGGASTIANMLVTDTLPVSLTYNSNSLIATSGTYGYNSGVITWTGSLNAGNMVTLTFGATVNQATSLSTTITNATVISGGGEIFTRSATVDISPAKIYLPLVGRNFCSPFSDNFSNPASGWPIADNGQVRWEYLSGEYRILVRPTDWWAGARPGVKCFSDYVLAVDVRNATGADGTYGLIFGLSDDWEQFYTFEIAPNGYYYLWRYNGGGYWTSLRYGYSPSINTGTSANRIKIERVGAQIKAYANDQLLTTLSDSTYTGARRVGLIVASYSQPNVDARFDNFVMCAPGCSGAASLSGAGVTSQGTVNPTIPSSVGAMSSGASGSKAIGASVPTPQPEDAPAERDVWRSNEAEPN